MKKIFLTMMALVAMSISAWSETIRVKFYNGQTIEGELIYRDDTLIRMTPVYYNKGEEMRITPDRVNYFELKGIGRFNVEDGRFVPTAKAQERLEVTRAKKHLHEQAVQERVKKQLHDRASDPNAVIAHALKTSGATSIGIGVPSLFVSSILIAYGSTGLIATPKSMSAVNKNAVKSRCATAGYILMPFGAALTIVGVPLYVQGKRIAELNFNYTGNGAGIAMNF